MSAFRAGAFALVLSCASGDLLLAQAPQASPSAEPVRIGGQIKAPTKLKDVALVYPDAARSSRIQGIVILDLTVSAEGAVTETKVLRSIPGLDDAAIQTVRQWRYAPTLVDGQAVPVRMTVSLKFTIR